MTFDDDAAEEERLIRANDADRQAAECAAMAWKMAAAAIDNARYAASHPENIESGAANARRAAAHAKTASNRAHEFAGAANAEWSAWCAASSACQARVIAERFADAAEKSA